MPTFKKQMRLGLCLMALVGTTAWASEASNDAAASAPVAVATPQPDWHFDESDHVVIPFNLVNNRIIISAVINGKANQKLIFDTGSRLLIDSSALADPGATAQTSLQVSGLGGGKQDAGRVSGLDITLGNLHINRQVALSADISRIGETDAIGWIGTDLLSKFVVSINFDTQQLTLSRPDTFHYDGSARAIPLRWRSHHLLAKAAFDKGAEGEWVLSTGASNNVLVGSAFVQQFDLFNRLTTTREYRTGEGVGGYLFGRSATVETFQFGGYAMPPIGAALSSMKSGGLANDKVAGNIGIGVLKRFNITLDAPHKVLYLQPNTHFHDADDFAIPARALHQG